jgi:hypothetical protein
MNDNQNNLNIPLVSSIFNKISPPHKKEEDENSKNNILAKQFGLELKDNDVVNLEAISTELLKMGFPPRQVMNSFLVYKYKSVEEGLELLSKSEESLWNHRFIEGDLERCFICEDLESQHRSIKTILEKKATTFITHHNKDIEIDKLLERRKSIKHNDNNFSLKINVKSCQICFLEVEDENKFNLNCQHQFCRECIIEYLKEEIKNARIEKLKCPTVQCLERFDDQTIKSLVSEEIYYKYQKFLLRAKIKDNDNLVVCPIRDCEGFADKKESIKKFEEEEKHNHEVIEIDLNNNNDVNLRINSDDVSLRNQQESTPKKIKYTCDKGHSFCSQCNQAYHFQSPCDQDQEIKNFATYSGYIVKKCPRCRVWTEKNEGCNHMTCKICQYSWCWLCEQECSPDHYFREGTPCYGKQFNNQNPEDLNYQMLMHADSFWTNFLFVYIFTFQIIHLTIRSLYRRRNENNPDIRIPPPPNKICAFISLFCLNSVFLICFVFFNGFILFSMLKNLNLMNQIRNDCCKVIILFTYVLLWLALYLNGVGLALLWFGIINIFTFFKLVCA